MAGSPFSNYNFRKTFILIGITWIALHIYMLFSIDVEIKTAITDSFVSTLITAFLCWLISNNLSYYQPEKNKFYTLVIWCLFLAFINTTILALVLPSFVPDAAYDNFIENSLPIRFALSFLLIGLMAMISVLWYNQQDKALVERRKNEAEKLNKEAELTSLREKLQPHFLFNSLNSISALTFSKPAEARKMIHQLSDFLRGTIRQDDQPASLKSEMEHLKLYLEIEKVRFGNRLSSEITCNDFCANQLVPPMILQPLVENAIKFGLYDTIDDILITINCDIENELLKITIKNPFDPSTAYPNKGTGFGLSSVSKRLQLFYNRSDLLLTQKNENEFTAILYIPLA